MIRLRIEPILHPHSAYDTVLVPAQVARDMGRRLIRELRTQQPIITKVRWPPDR